MLKPSLQLRLSQQLTMTPQLQQAIRLLQLSTMELQTEVQDALESNLMLELDEEGNAPVGTESGDQSAEPELDVAPGDIPSELPVDTAWEDIYDSVPTIHGMSEVNGVEYETPRAGVETLTDHLLWQLGLTRMSDLDKAIATAIIDSAGDQVSFAAPAQLSVVPTLDTGAYASGDSMDTTVLSFTSAVTASGGSGWITAARFIDKDDQGVDMSLYLYDSSVTPASENAAHSLSDADSAKYIDVPDPRVFDYLLPVLELNDGEFNAQYFFNQCDIIGGDTAVAAGNVDKFDGRKVRIRRESDNWVVSQPAPFLWGEQN